MRRLTASLLSVATVVGLVGLTGCGLFEPTEDSISVEITNGSTIGTITQSGTANAVANVEAKVRGNGTPITLEVSLKDANGNTPAGITVAKVGSEPSDKSSFDIGSGKDMQITITVTPEACRGNYTLSLTAKLNEKSNVATQTINVQGAKDCSNTSPTLTSHSVTLGGHGNATLGSSVDLDANPPTPLLAAAAKAAGAAVDIVYSYSSTIPGGPGPVIMTPHYAVNSSGITAFQGWTGANQTPFHKVTASSVNLTTITAAGVQALYNETQANANAQTGRALIAVNDIWIVKTNQNAYVLIRIDSVSSDASGTATILVAK